MAHGSKLMAQLTRILKFIWSGLLLLLCIIGIGWVLSRISLNEVTQAIGRADPMWLGLTVLMLFISQLFRGLRWLRLVQWETRATLAHTWYPQCGGQVINWLSPVRVGDIWRVSKVIAPSPRSPAPSLFWAATTLLIEKSSDALAIGLYALSLLFLPLPQAVPQGIVQAVALAVGLFLVAVAVLALRPERWQAQFTKRWGSLAKLNLSAAPEVQARRDQQVRTPRNWAEFAVICLIIYVNAVATNVALAHSLGMNTAIVPHIFYFVLLMTGMAASMIPGNVLLHPALAVLVFPLFGVDPALALAFGAVLYVLGYGVNLLLWAALWLMVDG